MKVIQTTPDLLTARFRPWFKWTIGICLISLGVVALLQVHWASFDCNRSLSLPTQGLCTLTDHHWLTRSHRSWPLAQIQGVKLEPRSRMRSGEPTDYHIFLITTQGPIELPLIDSFHLGRLQGTAESIRQFLANPSQPNLRVQVDERSGALYGFSLLGGAGCAFILLGQTVILRMSKSAQKLIVQRRYLLVLTRTIEYPLNQISDVMVQEKRNFKGHAIGRVVIVLKDRQRLIVHPYDSMGMAFWSDQCVNKIYAFLKSG